LDGLGQFTSNAAKWNPILADLLKHPAWGARRNVLRVMPRTAASATAISTACSVNDPHGHVRLQALVAIDDINPGSKPAMFDSYRNADSYATSLATAAGVTSSATMPCEPAIGPVSVEGSSKPGVQLRSDLRFIALGDGFRLQPHGQLPSGEITVTGLDGREVFRSVYDSQNARWSQAEMHGLSSSIYLYSFRGNDGVQLQGRMAIASGAF
jgi:hypothetical protein